MATTIAAFIATVVIVASSIAAKPAFAEEAVGVTVANFIRAESDLFFSNTVALGGFGKFYHYRTPPTIDTQPVVRMNRDTLYSAAVFDLDAGPVTITLPEADGRFMSFQAISEDHFSTVVEYAPATVTLTRENVATRYVMANVRTLINATDPGDVKKANALQDQISFEQAAKGSFEIPNWNTSDRDFIRTHLQALQSKAGVTTERRMGKKGEVDPVFHLLATATGWGLNPPEDAVYWTVYPKENDGKTEYKVTVKDVPQDGFWSITVYDAEGHLFENPQKAYSVNSGSAKPDADGGYTIQFGGDPAGATNFLAITKGWNYSARIYRPRKAAIDAGWTFPEPQLVK